MCKTTECKGQANEICYACVDSSYGVLPDEVPADTWKEPMDGLSVFHCFVVSRVSVEEAKAEASKGT